MKKKKLKKLSIRKHRISNLALLHKMLGGALNPNANTEPSGGVSNTLEDPSKESDCASWCFITCNTNGATTRAQPPSENEECRNFETNNIRIP
ncbi:hypothetical protein [Kordia sp.]|uniref:hypothetical protein n=1 Tax=Kordia sp. TaxID=1965332 RepID=UPI003B5B77C3